MFNARSLNNKLPELHELLRRDYSMVFVTESWLKNNILDGHIDNSGQFCIFRRDRPVRAGGGVLALVSKSYSSYKISIPEKFCSLEIVAFTLIMPTRKYRFITVYRPPEFNLIGRQYMKLLCECLEFLCKTEDILILVGDFNLPCIDWVNFEAPSDDIQNVFLDFCVQRGLHQMVNECTRDNRCIDLVFTSDALSVLNVNVCVPFSTSDHCVVDFEMLIDQTGSEEVGISSEWYFDYDNADIDSIVSRMQNHPFNNDVWNAHSEVNVCFTDSADDIWRKFISPLNGAIDEFVPLKPRWRRITGSKHIRKYPRHIRRALRKKHVYWKAYKKTNLLQDKAQYYCQADFCKKLVFDYERSREQQVIQNSSLGAFYRYVNRKLLFSSGVGILKTNTGQMVANASEKATLLNEYFCSVFTQDDGKLPPLRRRVSDDVSIENIEFTPARVLKAVNQIKNKRSLDPNGFSPVFIKKLCYVLIKPLCVLFNFLYNCGQFPNDWRLANVIPVFKKGSTTACDSYRPISLTSIFCKLFERILKEQILIYLYQNRLISCHQHGFLSKSSTCTQLLESVNDWSLAISNRRLTDIIYFDFSKAFDSVSHQKLIHKLSAYGLTGRLLDIIDAFLSNRFQRVTIDGVYSTFKPVTSGVPQGSVLGPLLFLLFINDVTDLFDGTINVKLYADDIKIYLEIVNDASVQCLQRGINDLCS